MAAKAKGQQGYDFEELLRAYFLRAGFFVLRGVPLRFGGDDATDLDIWLYERPTGTARRVQIVDAKFKARPKAVERIFWTKGLATALEVDGAYVATTDKRKTLRPFAKRIGISLIDGGDLERIRNVVKLEDSARLTEEELQTLLRSVDSARHNREYSDGYSILKGGVAEVFGAPMTNRGLDTFNQFSRLAVEAHRGSEAAEVAGRVAYMAAALTAVALDFVSTVEPFQTNAERRKLFLAVIRLGTTSEAEGLERFRIATALARNYAQNGTGVAAQIQNGYERDLAAIPAEIIADQAIKMVTDGTMFSVARLLEERAFAKRCPSFDQLTVNEKAFVGTLLDFVDVGRASFATAWGAPHAPKSGLRAAGISDEPQDSDSGSGSGKGGLFD